jgi:hypothetical protein
VSDAEHSDDGDGDDDDEEAAQRSEDSRESPPRHSSAVALSFDSPRGAGFAPTHPLFHPGNAPPAGDADEVSLGGMSSDRRGQTQTPPRARKAASKLPAAEKASAKPSAKADEMEVMFASPLGAGRADTHPAWYPEPGTELKESADADADAPPRLKASRVSAASSPAATKAPRVSAASSPAATKAPHVSAASSPAAAKAPRVSAASSPHAAPKAPRVSATSSPAAAPKTSRAVRPLAADADGTADAKPRAKRKRLQVEITEVDAATDSVTVVNK